MKQQKSKRHLQTTKCAAYSIYEAMKSYEVSWNLASQLQDVQRTTAPLAGRDQKT